MGAKTKIDWCDSSFNPVTGCYHGCEYCYARNIATRFAGRTPEIDLNDYYETEKHGLDVDWGSSPSDTSDILPMIAIDKPQLRKSKNGNLTSAPYPFGFIPTFHRYKLNELQKWKKPKVIFVGSMTDLFAEYIPKEWITDVLNACRAAPQHTYLFLTKNPWGYDYRLDGATRNMHFGVSVTNNQQLNTAFASNSSWLSIEPILEELTSEYFEDDYFEEARWDWIVIGAETGNRKGKVIPKKDWVMKIVDKCQNHYHWKRTPIFMKESLRGIMGDDFRQEFPWEVIHNARSCRCFSAYQRQMACSKV